MDLKSKKQILPSKNETDIFIFNLWWSLNYGAILTAYALQQSLNDWGYKSKLVHYVQDWCRIHFPNSFSEKFAKRHLQVTEPFDNYEDIIRLNQQANTFIVGSDQVFRQKYNQQQGFYFYLPFVDPDKKKIACAASFGIDHLEGNSYDNRLKKYYLSCFDAVSVREMSGVKICHDELDCYAEKILDPVFWLSADHWQKLAELSDLNCKNYVFSYVLDNSSEIKHQLENIYGKINEQEIVTLGKGQKKEIGTISPEDWIYYIKNCNFLITDSFHGVCFAIIFNKPFICLVNQERGLTRFESLFADIGIDLHDYHNEKLDFTSIDYKNVNSKLQEKIAYSREWMRQALARPKSTLSENKEIFSFFMQQLDICHWKLAQQKHQINEIRKILSISGTLWPYKLRCWRYKCYSLLFQGKKRQKYKIKYNEYKQKLEMFMNINCD